LHFGNLCLHGGVAQTELLDFDQFVGIDWALLESETLHEGSSIDIEYT
jgi:hypothetical protein